MKRRRIWTYTCDSCGHEDVGIEVLQADRQHGHQARNGATTWHHMSPTIEQEQES